VRLVSYNILNGGEGRADPLAEVILAQCPDIVALVEADSADVLDRIASRLKMDCFHARGRTTAAAVLSRWPIVEAVNHAALRPEISKSFVEAKVREPSGREWNFGVVHLHARATDADERIREGEIEVVLDVFAGRRRRGTAHVLAGDFNADAPEQLIDPAQCKPATRKAWEHNGGNLPRRVVSKMLAEGYVDTLLEIEPKKARTIGSFTTQYPGQRVDYIFGFGIDRARIRSAWIERDRLAKYASDHFPIGVEIE
jgi:endonuclease/exonuclease/phosphatase family metal-dependent hydrolase